ncbi:sigma-E processing peptidase SpoIIGA [Siminovitchia sediminis]|uniref:Sporulation sigma-E factor-processing peptidase n=1 Tax=Siminovitchia sediminis TaxID=1274353 RepID=A0ABW4KHY4_9BACI
MTIYMDVIWLLNFLVDSLLLWFTAIILKRQVSMWRVILAGLMGASLILFTLTPLASWAAHPLAKIGVSGCMVWTVFGFKRLKLFVTCLLTFYFSTFLFGGILLGTHYFIRYDIELQTAVSLDSIRGFGDPVSWLFVAAAFPVAWYFSKKRVEDLTASSVEYDVLIDLTIHINDLDFQMKGLIDSGNQLYEPISKTPVMVLSITRLKDQLPAVIQHLSVRQNNPLDFVHELPDEWSNKMRLVPAKTLGDNNQLLCAFKPDALYIHMGQGQRAVKKALIIFTDQELSSDGQFQCIVHPLMVEQSVIQPAS